MAQTVEKYVGQGYCFFQQIEAAGIEPCLLSIELTMS
jgi:hypothetical protein